MSGRPTADIMADLRSPKDAWVRYDDSDAEHPDASSARPLTVWPNSTPK